MLISAQHLVDRLRHPRSRADDLAALRRRFAAAPGPVKGASGEEIDTARELLRLRLALTEALAGRDGEPSRGSPNPSGVSSCSGCAKGHPLPHGRWSGGHCCGTRTELVFTDDEIGALRLSGTTPERLVPPDGDHAGCAFRGPEGCSLDPADRPNICVRFICRELEEELAERGDRRPVKALAASLGQAFERWRRLRAERVAAEIDAEEGP